MRIAAGPQDKIPTQTLQNKLQIRRDLASYVDSALISEVFCLFVCFRRSPAEPVRKHVSSVTDKCKNL